jgi:hypothetical protein
MHILRTNRTEYMGLFDVKRREETSVEIEKKVEARLVEGLVHIR